MGISVKDSKLSELARMIAAWPGLVAGDAQSLVEDSLVLLEHLGEAKTLVDVGSGGGLPGIPLKLARALAAMPVLAELCLPLVRVGGRLLAQKTEGEDLEAARNALEILGGSLISVLPAPSPARAYGT